MIEFKINPEQKTAFPHYWEMCVGSCHAVTALREDYRQQLIKARRECGFKYVRFHGLFDDNMSVCVADRDFMTGEITKIWTNFVNVDNIFDFFLSIGMKPFIEMGFMPTALASGTKTCFHYKGNVTMPKDMGQWSDFITAFTLHLVDRYGLEEVRSWFFEVWNEPNLPLFFAGTQADYFKLYEATVRAIKSVDLGLVVGGPSTSINAWIPELIDFCAQGQVPLDFISTHHYPSDDPLWRADMPVEEYFAKFGFGITTYERGVIKKMTTKARAEAGQYPLYYTEWNISARFEPNHDDNYAAAMVAKILADNDGLVEGYSYWTFSDIFEEFGQVKGFFHGGFGLQTYSGVAKPVYRMFELMHGLGTQRLAVVNNGGNETTVEALAVQGDASIKVLIYNHNVPDQPIEDQLINIRLTNVSGSREVKLCRIDRDHGNAFAAWQAMGSPEYPSREQIAQLHRASELTYESAVYQDGLQLTIPAQGVCLVEICQNI